MLIIILLAFAFSSITFLILGIILICCFHRAFYVYGMFSASSNFFFKTLKGKEYFDHRSGILFRFDDGPDPVYTPQILDILKSEGIQALFAVTGKNAEMYPEIVARMYRENHIIANHTYSHPLNILFLGYHRIRNELTTTNTMIQSITGVQPKYFCPPMGHKNPVIGKVIRDLGLIPIMWDIRTLDTHASFSRIMAEIKRKLKSPAIIMFHDAIMPWSKKDRESTVLALKETIRILKEQKYI
jgi:peptidoglycan-N-acetylglucosamine deacetylase